MAPSEKLNILLVDDQPAKLLSYEVVLEELGENLIKTHSAKEALEQLLKTDIALILIDVCMPDLDGFELASMIREHPRFEATAIIFVSAIHLTDIDRIRGYEYGALDYVPVPVVPALLRAKVKVFCELYRKSRELEKLNGELERRVAERTAELEEANNVLERRVEERTREREVALNQIHEMQKLESLGHLTGGVAHDFNNLLMGVLGNLHLLRRRAADFTEWHRFIDGAIDAAERGAVLTKRMLTFARREELKPEAVNLASLCTGMLEMLSRTIGPSIRIDTVFASELPLANVDPNQFELAVLNLSLNARDAMPQGGSLTFVAEMISGSDPKSGDLANADHLRFAVTDTGHGMDAATLSRATEPFFTTKQVGQGTGLGLSMVHGFVSQSGGKLRIESTPGAGTTIELLLPMAEQQIWVPTVVASAEPVGQRRDLKVLLVDDDSLVLDISAEILRDLGCQVHDMRSGKAALEALAGGLTVDIVITDHAMPGMSGTKLATKIRKVHPDLPILIVTGNAGVPEIENAGFPTILKPYSAEDLSNSIDALLPRNLKAGRVSLVG